ncbi:MAG: hypothetical protein GEU75_04095 [Dehalococcoidia bacterium]|nr:hypothetical protein [Dehalococcoidia bacterium]
MVLPIFLVLVMGTIDFGWALRSYITLTNAAREGARVGIIGETEANIISTTKARASGILDSSGTVTVTGEQGNPGTVLKVAVSSDYAFITPLGGLVDALAGPLTLSTSTSMRME